MSEPKTNSKPKRQPKIKVPESYPYNPPEKFVDETHWFKDSFSVSIIGDRFIRGLVHVMVNLNPKNASAETYKIGEVTTMVANPNDIIEIGLYKKNIVRQVSVEIKGRKTK